MHPIRASVFGQRASDWAAGARRCAPRTWPQGTCAALLAPCPLPPRPGVHASARPAPKEPGYHVGHSQALPMHDSGRRLSAPHGRVPVSRMPRPFIAGIALLGLLGASADPEHPFRGGLSPAATGTRCGDRCGDRDKDPGGPGRTTLRARVLGHVKVVLVVPARHATRAWCASLRVMFAGPVQCSGQLWPRQQWPRRRRVGSAGCNPRRGRCSAAKQKMNKQKDTFSRHRPRQQVAGNATGDLDLGHTADRSSPEDAPNIPAAQSRQWAGQACQQTMIC